jgi:hypothetical protein
MRARSTSHRLASPPPLWGRSLYLLRLPYLLQTDPSQLTQEVERERGSPAQQAPAAPHPLPNPSPVKGEGLEAKHRLVGGVAT